MYLAQIEQKRQKEYIIRTSVQIDNYYIHKDLFHLGKNPQKYIKYQGRNSFYIDETVIDEINNKGVKADQTNIEHIFYPFLPWEIRSIISSFQRNRKKNSCIPSHKLKSIHPFDKFRLYYLKFQDQKQTYLQSLPENFFSVLACKSRDELEQYFLVQEKLLKETELKDYIFASFNLKYFFSQRLKRIYPELCPEEELDDAFLKQLCGLSEDPDFTKGIPQSQGLNYYLVRYACMYFDSQFASERINNQIFENFLNSRRKFRPIKKKPQNSVFIKVFGKSYEELQNMNKKQLKRLFREKAKDLHPDKGGDKKDFHDLCACYRSLTG